MLAGHKRDFSFYKTGSNHFNKHTDDLLISNLDEVRKNDCVFLDIGCGSGTTCVRIREKFSEWVILGSDSDSDLIQYCEERNQGISFFVDDVTAEPISCLGSVADITYSSGVISIFDSPIGYLEGLLSRTKIGGRVIIHGIFHPGDLDQITRYKVVTDDSDIETLPSTLGWNIFSIKTVSRLLVEKFGITDLGIHKIVFPNNIDVPRRPEDPIRSYTVKFNGDVFFMNDLNILQHQFFITFRRPETFES